MPPPQMINSVVVSGVGAADPVVLGLRTLGAISEALGATSEGLGAISEGFAPT